MILGNGFGVAIASDSAQTGKDAHGQRVTYETADKIHPLGPPHLLAILECGTVHFFGMPVGVLVDEWKDSLGNKRLRSVEGYRDNFLAWMDDNLDLWADSRAREDAAFDAAVQRLRFLDEEVIGPAIRGAQEVHQPDLALSALRLKNEELSGLQALDPALVTMADNFFARWSQEGDEEPPRPALGDTIENHFDRVPRSAEIDAEIWRFLKLTIEKGDNFPVSGTGTELNFVGFGDKDQVPAVACVGLHGALDNHVVRRLIPTQVAQRTQFAYFLVRPIAQCDMIHVILKGHDRGLISEVARSALEWSRRVIDEPVEQREGSRDSATSDVAGEESATPENFVEAFVEDFERQVEALSGKRYVTPALHNIAGVPLATLAELARSLVSVQNLAQNIRGELQTVGGDIDVGTITLNEGFRWASHA